MKPQALIDALSALQRRHSLALFLGLGAALFAVDGLRGGQPALPSLPAGVESPQAAQQWLEDEVLYREAVARGLGEGDLIIRRRLVQKMRLLLEVGVEVAEPGETELREWIDRHAGRYGGVARLSFDHVFISRGRHDARLGEAAAAVAETLRLQPDAELAPLSDPHPGGTRIDGLSAIELDRQFGKALAPQLAELPTGRWQGPLASSLGLHLVRIRERQTQTPDYAAVRDRAQRDYLLDQREAKTQLALDRLKARYGAASGASEQP